VRRISSVAAADGRAKLTRKRDAKTIRSGLCTFFEKDDKRLIFDDAPRADDAAVLRKVIPIASEGCAQKLASSLLGK
jgi:hypothetical protein